MTDRIDAIRKLLEKEPSDIFLVYSLGMEYASAGRLDEAISQFARCLELDADYLPAYGELGKAQRSAGKLDDARRTFQQGMDLAARKSEKHTRDYLQQQLEGLGKA